MDGADQASIRAYLQSVVEVKPTRFQVQWNPDTVAVSRDEAMKSLQSVSEDGSEYTFDSSEPVVSKLKPGRILWIWGIALRRVSSVGRLGGSTLVSTVPVSLPDALTQADIAFDSSVNFANSFVGMRPHQLKQAAPPKTSRLESRSQFRRVMMTTEPAPGGNPPQTDGAPGEDQTPVDDYGVVAATGSGYTGQIAGFEYSLGYHVLPDHLVLELQARKEVEGADKAVNNETKRDQRAEFFEAVKEQREARKEMFEQYHRLMDIGKELENLANPNKPVLRVTDPKLGVLSQQSLDALAKLDQKDLNELNAEARAKLDPKVIQSTLEKYKKAQEEEEKAEIKKKRLAAAGAIAKQVFYIVYDNLDVRFKAKMDLNQVALASAMSIKDGNLKNAAASFKNIGGHIDLEFVGRLGKPGSGMVSIPVAHVPLQMTIPVPVYGIPFVFQVGTDFLIKLSLVGLNAAIHFSGSFDFNGGTGLQANTEKSETPGTVETSDPKVEDAVSMSPGVSATVLGIQLPRLGLGLGLFGAAGMVFVDLVNVLTTTNSASVTTMLGPQCTRYTLDTSVHVGVDATIMPIPIPLVESIASSVLSQKKEVGHHTWKRVNPPIKMCEIEPGEST